jgi:hypothetical protein
MKLARYEQLRAQLDEPGGKSTLDGDAPPLVTATVCGLGRRCRYCRTKVISGVLCDGPGKTPGTTCDAFMCRKCATSAPNRDLDYCHTHAAFAAEVPA